MVQRHAIIEGLVRREEKPENFRSLLVLCVALGTDCGVEEGGVVAVENGRPRPLLP